MKFMCEMRMPLRQDRAMNSEMLLAIGGLALLDTLSPATLGITVYMLLGNKEGLAKRLMVFLLTVAGFYFTVGVFLMLGLGFLADIISDFFQIRFAGWTVFLTGVCLFIASFYVPARKHSVPSYSKSAGVRSAAALGLAASIAEAGTAFPYFTAIGIMAASNLPWTSWSPVLAGYNFIMVMPSLLLYMLSLLLGRSIQKSLERLRLKIAAQSGSALSWIMCIVGVILIFTSLDYL